MIPRRIFPLLVLLGLGGPTALLAQPASPPAQPQIHTTLETQPPIWQGQRVAFIVELAVPGYFSGTPGFDFPDPKGILLFPPTSHPTLDSKVIAGVRYTIQRHELTAFPMQAGRASIPALKVHFSYKPSATSQDIIPVTLATPPFPLTVKTPPGAEGIGQLLSARDLKITEQWKPEPSDTANLPAGTAFTRTITYSAPDVPGMVFPPFETDPIDGLGIYQKHDLLDESNRGSLEGKRVDTITYVCKSPGQYTIPATRFTWFDLDTQQLRTINFPAHTLHVVVNPQLASHSSSAAPATHRPLTDTLRWLLPAFVLLAAIVIFFRRSPRFRRLLHSWIAPFQPRHLQPMNPSSHFESS